jgi:hypothetical protein
MTEAFDKVVLARLLHNMRERKGLELIVKWVGNFINNITMTLCMPGYNTNTFPTHTGISQGSPLLPILFLIYNANLVEICSPLTLPASVTGFVDDVNALACGNQQRKTAECCKLSMSGAWSGPGGMRYLLPQKCFFLCTSQRQGGSTTSPAPSSCPLLLYIQALLHVFWACYSTRYSAGSLTCNTSY